MLRGGGGIRRESSPLRGYRARPVYVRCGVKGMRETHVMARRRDSGLVRPVDERPPWHRVVRRTVAITIITTLALWLLAAILPGFAIDSRWHALLAGLVIGVANAVVWPALSFLVVPLSVLTLG